MSSAAGTPSPSRPGTVSAAYWVWLVAAVLAVLTGVYLASAGATVSSTSDGLRRLAVGVGVINVLVGLGLGFLAARVRAGEPRSRRALVALSIVYAFFGVVQGVVGLVVPVLLLAALLVLAAVALVATPSARAFFAAEAG